MKEHLAPQKIPRRPGSAPKKNIAKLNPRGIFDKSMVAGTILLLLAVIVGAPPYFSRPLDKKRINVHGADILARDKVVEYLAVPNDKSWLSLDPYVLASRLKRRLWINKAMVRKKFPSGLDVYIHEEKPTAYFRTGKRLYFITEDNLLLNILPSSKKRDYPVIADENIKGKKPGDRLPASKLRGARELMEVLKKSRILPLGAASEIIISDPLNIQAIAGPRGLRIKFGFKNFKQKLTNLYYALPEINKSKTNIEYIDLRYKRGLAIKKLKN